MTKGTVSFDPPKNYMLYKSNRLTSSSNCVKCHVFEARIFEEKKNWPQDEVVASGAGAVDAG